MDCVPESKNRGRFSYHECMSCALSLLFLSLILSQTHLLVSHAIQIAEDRVRQERDQDEIRGYLTQILNEFRSQVSSETSLNIQPAGATLNVVSQSTDRYNRRTPHSPPIAGSSPDVLLPQVHRLVALEVPESQIGLCQTTRTPSICNKVEGRISSGNVEGLVYHLIRTGIHPMFIPANP